MELVEALAIVAGIAGSIITIWKLSSMLLEKTKTGYKNYKDRKYREQANISKEVILEILPDILNTHDLQTRDRYLSDREKYLKEIKDEVIHDQNPIIEEIQKMNSSQNKRMDGIDEALNILQQGQKDVLRKKIMDIYEKGKFTKQLSYDDRDDVDALYHDYKAIGGNTYIDKRYRRMTQWEVLEDDYIED